MQISCTVTVQLISTFVFDTQTIQSLYFLNPKFQASSHLLWLYTAWFVPDLVRNPKTGFLITLLKSVFLVNLHNYPTTKDSPLHLPSSKKKKLYEPRCEKTGLRGFRPGLTQTRCTATEDCQKLESSDLGSRGIVLSV